jgi:hypothetical protein
MDKSFFCRPKMSKLLRGTVAKQLRHHGFGFGPEDFKARVMHEYEESHRKAA